MTEMDLVKYSSHKTVKVKNQYFVGSITKEEMKLIYVMMCEEPEHKELEPTEYKLAIKEIERKADDMFVDLDADGDGFLTEVKSEKRDIFPLKVMHLCQLFRRNLSMAACKMKI